MIVSSICLAVMLKDSCGSANRCLIGGVANDAATPSLSTFGAGGFVAAVATGFRRGAAEALRWAGLFAGRMVCR